MSANYNRLSTDPEVIGTEQELLRSIQNLHYQELLCSGVLETVETALREEDDNLRARDTLTSPCAIAGKDMSSAVVCLVKPVADEENYQLIEPDSLVPAIRVTTHRPSKYMPEGETGYAYVRLQEINADGRSRPTYRFTVQDVDVVANMLQGLQDAKDTGVLDNLSANLADIDTFFVNVRRANPD